MSYPPADDRLRHLLAQRINCHVDTWKLAFFIAGAVVDDLEIRAELDRVAASHAAGEPCGDRNCRSCFTASTTAAAGSRSLELAEVKFKENAETLNPAVVSVPPSADRAALRDLIGQVLRPWMAAGDETDVNRRVGHAADAVMAVMPAPADRATLLREAADIAESLRQFERCTGPRRAAQTSENVGILRVADHLRQLAVEADASRMAAEEQPAETQASTAPLAAGLPLVKGRCPACGRASLFLGNGGYVTCSVIECAEPDAASTLLEPAVGEQPDTQTPEADRIVAYVPTARTELHCLRCAPNPAGDIWTPVTAEELDDGGICTVCGRDVLIAKEADRG